MYQQTSGVLPRLPGHQPVLPMKSSPTSSDAGRDWPRSRAEFAALVETYADRLVRYAFRQTGNLHDAEDIVAFDTTPARAVSAVGPYLYRAVGNSCIDFLRRRNRAALFCEEVGIEEVFTDQAGPPEAALANEEIRRVETLLKRLPPEQAEVVRLRVFDELSLHDIAELTGCSINTVCSRLRYAFAKLRSAIDKEQE